MIVIPIFTLAFEAIGFSIALPTLGQAVAYAALTSLAVWGGTEASKLLSDVNIVHNEAIDQNNEKKEKRPPYSGANLGKDPSKCPGEGFEWKGEGAPGSKRGNWYNSEKEHSLRGDLEHPEPIKPHWDYMGPDGDARLFEDGTYEWK